MSSDSTLDGLPPYVPSTENVQLQQRFSHRHVRISVTALDIAGAVITGGRVRSGQVPKTSTTTESSTVKPVLEPAVKIEPASADKSLTNVACEHWQIKCKVSGRKAAIRVNESEILEQESRFIEIASPDNGTVTPGGHDDRTACIEGEIFSPNKVFGMLVNDKEFMKSYWGHQESVDLIPEHSIEVVPSQDDVGRDLDVESSRTRFTDSVNLTIHTSIHSSEQDAATASLLGVTDVIESDGSKETEPFADTAQTQKLGENDTTSATFRAETSLKLHKDIGDDGESGKVDIFGLETSESDSLSSTLLVSGPISDETLKLAGTRTQEKDDVGSVDQSTVVTVVKQAQIEGTDGIEGLTEETKLLVDVMVVEEKVQTSVSDGGPVDADRKMESDVNLHSGSDDLNRYEGMGEKFLCDVDEVTDSLRNGSGELDKGETEARCGFAADDEKFTASVDLLASDGKTDVNVVDAVDYKKSQDDNGDSLEAGDSSSLDQLHQSSLISDDSGKDRGSDTEEFDSLTHPSSVTTGSHGDRSEWNRDRGVDTGDSSATVYPSSLPSEAEGEDISLEVEGDSISVVQQSPVDSGTAPSDGRSDRSEWNRDRGVDTGDSSAIVYPSSLPSEVQGEDKSFEAGNSSISVVQPSPVDSDTAPSDGRSDRSEWNGDRNVDTGDPSATVYPSSLPSEAEGEDKSFEAGRSSISINLDGAESQENILDSGIDTTPTDGGDVGDKTDSDKVGSMEAGESSVSVYPSSLTYETENNDGNLEAGGELSAALHPSPLPVGTMLGDSHIDAAGDDKSLANKGGSLETGDITGFVHPSSPVSEMVEINSQHLQQGTEDSDTLHPPSSHVSANDSTSIAADDVDSRRHSDTVAIEESGTPDSDKAFGHEDEPSDEHSKLVSDKAGDARQLDEQVQCLKRINDVENWISNAKVLIAHPDPSSRDVSLTQKHIDVCKNLILDADEKVVQLDNAIIEYQQLVDSDQYDPQNFEMIRIDLLDIKQQLQKVITRGGIEIKGDSEDLKSLDDTGTDSKGFQAIGLDVSDKDNELLSRAGESGTNATGKEDILLQTTSSDIPSSETSTNVTAADINGRITDLKNLWHDLEQQAVEKDKQLERALALQSRYADAGASISSWIDSIDLQTLSEPDAVIGPQLEQLESVNQELDSLESLASLLPEGEEDMAKLRQRLQNLYDRLKFLEDEKLRKDQKASEAMQYLQKVQEELETQEDDLLRCQDEFEQILQMPAVSDSTTLTDRKEALDRLQDDCSKNLKRLHDLQDDLKLVLLQDSTLIQPASMPVLLQKWQQLFAKIVEKKPELTRLCTAVTTYKNELEQYRIWLESAKAKCNNADKPVVDDISDLTDQLSEHESFIDDLENHQRLLDHCVNKVDGNTGEQYRQQHEELNEIADNIRTQARDKRTMLEHQIDNWRNFQQRLSDVSTTLDKISRKLPQEIDDSSPVDELEQMLKECREVKNALENCSIEVYKVVDLGEQILQNVDAQTVRDEVDGLKEKQQAVMEEAFADVIRLETLVDQLEAFETESAVLETWLSEAKHRVQSLASLLGGDDLPGAEDIHTATQLLVTLKTECDDQQTHKTHMSAIGKKLSELRPDDHTLQDKLKRVDGDWYQLLNDVHSISEQLSKAQYQLLPSTQARNEMLEWMDRVSETLKKDVTVQPNDISDVQQLSNKYKLLKAEVRDYQQKLDYINECAQEDLNSSFSSQTVQPSVVEDINEQYRVISGEVDSYMSALEATLPSWEVYDKHLNELLSWLNQQSSKVIELKALSQGSETDEAISQCEVLNQEVTGKRSDIDLFHQQGDKLLKLELWPANADSIQTSTANIDEKYAALDNEVSELIAAMRKRHMLASDYSYKLKTLTEQLKNARASADGAEPSGCKNPSELTAVLSNLKDAELRFREAKNDLESLVSCSQLMVQESGPDAGQAIDKQTQQLVTQWHDVEQVLDGKISLLEKLETDWTKYDSEYRKALSAIEHIEKELKDLSADTLPADTQQNLDKIQALEVELGACVSQLNSLSGLVSVLTPQLDAVSLAAVTDSKASLDKRAADLQQALDQHRQQLVSNSEAQLKFATIKRAVEGFLGKCAGEQPEKTKHELHQRLIGVREILTKFDSMQPTMTLLEETGYQLPLSQSDADQLVDLRRRWNEIQDKKKEEAEELELLLKQVSSFHDKCEEWSKFVSRVETDLFHPPATSLQLLLDEKPKLAKFENDVPYNHQVLCTLIGEGHSLLESGGVTGNAVASLRHKLADLESQWQTLVNQANQRKAVNSKLLETWQTYNELKQKLEATLDDVGDSIKKNVVTDCTIDEAKHLLETYKLLEMKLHECIPIQDKLNSCVQILTPVSDGVVSEQLTVNLQNLKEQNDEMISAVEDNIDKLQNLMKLWSETETETYEFSCNLQETKQSLAVDLPSDDCDLESELLRLKNLEAALSADACLPHLKQNLDQLSSVISSKDTRPIAENLSHLEGQLVDARKQVVERQLAITSRLSKWSDFNVRYNRLCQALDLVEANVVKARSEPAEDTLASLQNKWLAELESVGKEKDVWNEFGVELKQASSELQARDIDQKLLSINDKYSQLLYSICNSIKQLQDLLSAISCLEESIKALQQWLVDTDKFLASPVVFTNANSDEIQDQLVICEELQGDVDKHGIEVSSVVSLCETLAGDSTSCPTSMDVAELQQTVHDLEERFSRIRYLSADRKRFIEKTADRWKQFNVDYSSLDDKVTVAEKQLKTFAVEGATFGEIQDKHSAILMFKQKIVQNILDELKQINSSYEQLVRDGCTDQSGTLQQQVEHISERCDALAKDTNTTEQRLRQMLEKKTNFEKNLNAVKKWLHGLDGELSAAELLADKRRLRALQDIQSNLQSNVHWLKNMDKAVDELTQTFRPSDVAEIKVEADKVHTHHSELLARVQELLQRQTKSKEPADDLAEIHELERSLEKSMGSVSAQLEQAVQQLNDDKLPVGECIETRAAAGLDRDGDLQQDSDQLSVDLDALERWLRHAESVLKSLHSKPQKLTDFEWSLEQQKTLFSEIQDWRPRVLAIRSSMRRIVQQNQDTEKLCERISSAMSRWSAVCDESHGCLTRLGNLLMIHDAFRVNIDGLLSKMDEVRDVLLALELNRLPSERTHTENQMMHRELAGIVYHLDKLRGRVDRLLEMSHCLGHSSRPAVGRRQIDQLQEMSSELEAVRQICQEHMALIRACSEFPLPGSVIPQGYVEDGEDSFSQLPEIPHLGVAPKVVKATTWADFHEVHGGEQSLSDLYCAKDHLSTIDGEPDTSDSLFTRTRRNLSRACCVAIPIQLTTLVLLGLSSLIPFYCCDEGLPPNSFLYSLYPLLRYTDGLPPL